MNLFQELKQRRVPQIASGYVVGGWGLLQFLAFLESRMAISPHLVNLIGLALVMFLPTVVTLAWVHGRPGPDTWGRTPKIVVPTNVLAAALALFLVFNGQRLGAVTQTIEVEDENGAVTERIVPHSEFRQRVLIYYPENKGAADDAWASELVTYLAAIDLSQDSFVDVMIPMSMADIIAEAGSPDGHNLSRPLQRKLAREGHWNYFQTGTISQSAAGWELTTKLYESESGKQTATRTITDPDLFAVVDQASRQLREDLKIPATHLNESPDLPVADITSSDLEATRDLVRALIALLHYNDWQGALTPLEDAVQRDPEFALAQFILFSVRLTLGQSAAASEAISTAMANLYRLPERLSFSVKAQYYFNEKQDADKALAVLTMWSQIYPNDVAAYEQQAQFYFVRQDVPNTIAAYEKVLAIDPSQVKYLDELADLYARSGDNEKAEASLQRYVSAFPTHTDGYENLADFYNHSGQFSKARQALEQAQILDPEDLQIELNLIDLNVKAGQYSDSETRLAKLLATAENNRQQARVHESQVKLARRRGQPAIILAGLRELHRIMLETQNPLQADIVYSIMLTAVSSAGQPDSALVELDKLKQKIPVPYNQLVDVSRAWALADLGRTGEATAALDSARVVVESFKFETYRSILAMVSGMIAGSETNLTEAATQFQLAVDKSIRPNGLYNSRLARSLRLDGQPEAAQTVLTEALRIEPACGRLHLEQAQLLADAGDLKGARQHLDEALARWDQAEPEFRPAQEARALSRQLVAEGTQ